ncbi:glycosyltransferase [Clostridium vincentii]|uniref:Glycosyltransferase n=1 Tax=Clostridium vincentii TaxID=52704 RepID=A0A2T0BE40_9CLOT|nr:glycosyltransferase [Clostridium vincentii]PRR82097.1 hypothetical protein CLVI_20320 [Clostridium vincentii]
MKKSFKILSISLVALTLLATPFRAYGADDKKATLVAPILKMQQRKLWSDHVLWTRSLIVSDLASLEDKEAVLQRLLKNQDDIGNSIKPYYGEEAGSALSKLLREHIVIGGQVIDAAKNDKKDDLEKYNKLWRENADAIAKLLSDANPNWPNAAVKDMLYKHLQFITEQVTSRISKDWEADIAAYDKGEDHMLMFADTVSDGIIKQFPQKFK